MRISEIQAKIAWGHQRRFCISGIKLTRIEQPWTLLGPAIAVCFPINEIFLRDGFAPGIRASVIVQRHSDRFSDRPTAHLQQKLPGVRIGWFVDVGSHPPAGRDGHSLWREHLMLNWRRLVVPMHMVDRIKEKSQVDLSPCPHSGDRAPSLRTASHRSGP